MNIVRFLNAILDEVFCVNTGRFLSVLRDEGFCVNNHEGFLNGILEEKLRRV